jgi:hypothetical protein
MVLHDDPTCKEFHELPATAKRRNKKEATPKDHPMPKTKIVIYFGFAT